MRYDNPQLRRLLAGEYVLGTLTGAARRRFERMLTRDSALRAEVAWWEARWFALRGVVPITPRAQVWRDIEARISGGARLATFSPTPAANDRLWRVWAGVASAMAAAFALALLLRAPAPMAPPPAPVVAAAPASYVALVQMPNSTMHWTLSITPAHGFMTAAAGGVPPPLEGHVPELWWLSPQGPVALGVLPVSGGGTMPLPKNLGAGGEIKLAVSIEPAGGSPTGKPTGPVVVSVAAVKIA